MEQLTRVKVNRWKISAVVLGILFVVVLFTRGISFQGITGQTISETEAQIKLNDFVQTYMSDPRFTITIDSIGDKSGLYQINLTVASQDGIQQVTSYITKDGSLLFLQGIELDNLPEPIDITSVQSTQ